MKRKNEMKPRARSFVSFVFALTACAAVGAPSVLAQNAAEPPASGPAASNRSTWIGPEDTITVFALNAEEISKPWRVSAAGELNLPVVGRIQAAGMTVEQLEQAIATRLETYMYRPQVTVYVSEKRSHPVTVTGAVEKPGIVQMRGPMSLFDVLVLAGSPKGAGPLLTLTRRKEQGLIPYPGANWNEDKTSSSIRLDVRQAMSGHARESLLTVLANDQISIEAGKMEKLVYISGEVNRPGAIELATQSRVSITKVVAMAGGLTRTSSAKKTMIRRVNAQGIETAVSFVDLNKILSGKARDIELGEGDIVIVPSNQIRSYLQSATTSAVSTGIWILGSL
jgi:polysaccharide export outer membrane protein